MMEQFNRSESGIHLDQTERSLPDNQLRFMAAILQSLEDAVISETLDGVITSGNPAAEKMFGYAADEVVGKPMSIIGPDDRIGEFKENDRQDHHHSSRRWQTVRCSLQRLGL